MDIKMNNMKIFMPDVKLIKNEKLYIYDDWQPCKMWIQKKTLGKYTIKINILVKPRKIKKKM